MAVSRGARVTRRAILLVAGLGAGWLGARQTAATDAPTAATLLTEVIATRDIGASITATGAVRPQVGAQVTVGSRASGVLRKLHATVGDRVTAGQLLAELDPAELSAQARRAEAAFAVAATERAFAASEYERAVQLAERNVTTGMELAESRRRMETSRAREAEAAALLDAARLQLDLASIRAPIAGVVATVSTQEGETVAASFAAPTFVTIIDLTRLELWAYVDETDIGRVQVGQRVQFRVDSYPDEMFGGRVTAVRPTAELRDNVVSYVTIIEIENRAGTPLRPEMTATVMIALDEVRDVVAVPNGALRRDASGSYVQVQQDGSIERRAVQLGMRGADYSEVKSGLHAGDRVVMGPAPCTMTMAENAS